MAHLLEFFVGPDSRPERRRRHPFIPQRRLRPVIFVMQPEKLAQRIHLPFVAGHDETRKIIGDFHRIGGLCGCDQKKGNHKQAHCIGSHVGHAIILPLWIHWLHNLNAALHIIATDNLAMPSGSIDKFSLRILITLMRFICSACCCITAATVPLD